MASKSSPWRTLHDGKKAPADDVSGKVGELYSVNYTIGAEDGSSVINVVLQLVDFFGNDLATVAHVLLWLSDNADGSTVGTAHSTSPAIGTDGVLHVLITDLMWIAVSESDGDIDIDFTDSGAQTVYLCAGMPDGRVVISDAITHAA